MNMARGVGRDGGVVWQAVTVTSWGGSTAYAAGAYVTNGGNLYQATVGGISASSGGPTGTATTDITDGTVTWLYRSAASWTAQTAFTAGSHLLISSQYYKCLEAGKSGSVQPTWSTTTVGDGTITWTHKTAAYETLVSDSDLCLFDDDLMIQGLKWRFLRAKGTAYADIKQEYERIKDSALNRFNSGRKFSLAGGSGSGVVYPSLPDGGWGL